MNFTVSVLILFGSVSSNSRADSDYYVTMARHNIEMGDFKKAEQLVSDGLREEPGNSKLTELQSKVFSEKKRAREVLAKKRLQAEETERTRIENETKAVALEKAKREATAQEAKRRALAERPTRLKETYCACMRAGAVYSKQISRERSIAGYSGVVDMSALYQAGTALQRIEAQVDRIKSELGSVPDCTAHARSDPYESVSECAMFVAKEGVVD